MYVRTSVHANVSVFIYVAGEKNSQECHKFAFCRSSFVFMTKFLQKKYRMKFSFMGFCSQISIANTDIHLSSKWFVIVDEMYFLPGAMKILRIRFITVVLYGAKRTDDVFWYVKNRH